MPPPVVNTNVSNGEHPVVSAHSLVKRYGENEAVKKVDFAIKPGEIFGFIGPDGAGKTSIFNIMGGVMDKSDGEISVLGKTPRLARPDVGYLTQKFSLYLDLSVSENISYLGGLREVPEKDFVERRDRYLKLMDLYRFRDRLAGQLSGGMKQKLFLCGALIARPKLLLLDEPTTGVDPVSRREFWDVLTSIAEEGVTVVLATPYLDEAERCHRVALIHQGVILEMDTPSALKNKLGLVVKRLEARSSDLVKLDQVVSELALSPEAHLLGHPVYGDRIDLLVQNVPEAKRLLEKEAINAGLTDISLEEHDPTLENVFVARIKNKTEKTDQSPYPHAPKNVTPSGPAVSATNISKFFGDFQAVKNVSLSINFGEVLGLLGANGAGKTTTIKMLCGLLEASAGEMMLAGQKSDLRNPAVRKDIGYMSQKFTLYDDLTVFENLEFYSGVYDVPKELKAKRIDWVIATCGLSGRENLITGQLPGGWKQRLAFAASVMHEPKILFLDEPTSGVDPLARRDMWRLIKEFARAGTAVLVTTHFLEEAEFCASLAFMVAGEIVAQGSPSEVKASRKGKLFELKTEDILHTARLLKQNFEPWRVSIFGDSIHIVLEDPELELKKLESLFSAHSIKQLSRRELPFSLEDVFIDLVQRRESSPEVPAA